MPLHPIPRAFGTFDKTKYMRFNVAGYFLVPDVAGRELLTQWPCSSCAAPGFPDREKVRRGLCFR